MAVDRMVLISSCFIYLLFNVVVFSEALTKGQPGVCENSKKIKQQKGFNFKREYYTCGTKKCSRMKKNPKYVYVDKKTIQCCSGWEFEENDSCKPVCRSGCSNGQCVAPEQCKCEPPLILQNNTTCIQPACDPACVNARCSAPNTCSCDPQFATYNTTHCAPICQADSYNDPNTLACRPKCDSPCINGICTDLDTCSCNEGYTLDDIDRFKCVPKCEPPCEHSTCDAPDTCSCHEGFKRESAWKCSPVCENCDHGSCIAPKTCECHDGYIKINGKCAPVCKSGCVNGYCSAPDICTCDPGYTSQNSSCVPSCEPSCVNSTCSMPNVCSCLEGYEATETRWICKPRCENCQNGQCVEPGKCQCDTGYSFKHPAKQEVNSSNKVEKDSIFQVPESQCTPDCEKECTNGFCSEPNVCTCHLGYIANDTDKFACHPVCDPKCENASCESPNRCSCFAGYESVENNWSCQPSCREPCRNGICVAPDECSCNEGYLKNNSEPSGCYKPCPGPCEMGACTDQGVCICNSGFELVNETCLAVTPIDCSLCDSNCTETICRCTNGSACFVAPERLSMAGLEKTWLVGSAVCLLLLTLACVVIQRTWRRRKQTSIATAESPDNETLYSSVIYTRPDTLMARHSLPEDHELIHGPLHDVAAAGSNPEIEEGNVLLHPATTIENEL